MEKGIFYRFESLDLRQFATFEDSYKEDTQEIEISCKFTFALNFNNNVVCCSNSISIVKSGNPLIKADLDAYFAINPNSIDALKQNDELVLPTELQAQFASLTYGTMRGVIFSKTLGSPLCKIVLPPNDVLEAIKKPLHFKLNNA